MNRNLAIFSVIGARNMCDGCYDQYDYFCGYIQEPYTCVCTRTLVTFFPTNYEELFYPKLPTTTPQETSYIVTVERGRTNLQLNSETIDSDVECYGFTVCDVDVEGSLPLLEILETVSKRSVRNFPRRSRIATKEEPFKVTGNHNTAIKKSDMYARTACERLTELILRLKSREKVEEEKKENPHMGKKRKKR